MPQYQKKYGHLHITLEKIESQIRDCPEYSDGLIEKVAMKFVRNTVMYQKPDAEFHAHSRATAEFVENLTGLLRANQ